MLLVANSRKCSDWVYNVWLWWAAAWEDTYTVFSDPTRVNGAWQAKMLCADVVFQVNLGDEVFAAGTFASPILEFSGCTEVGLSANKPFSHVCCANMDIEVVFLRERFVASVVCAMDQLLEWFAIFLYGMECFDVTL